jgi:transposase
VSLRVCGQLQGQFRFSVSRREYVSVMNKTYQFRIYPTKKQVTQLNRWLALCCQIYNAALQERRDAYRLAGVSLGLAEQSAELPACKQVYPELSAVNAQVLQTVVKRVDLAFQAFFRAVAAGKRAGYPRFKSRNRYRSLTFPQYAAPGKSGCFFTVPPTYTSQSCSCCGQRQQMPLSVRIYECPICGLVMDRDYNSSVNILNEACGRAGRVIPEASGLEPWGVVT